MAKGTVDCYTVQVKGRDGKVREAQAWRARWDDYTGERRVQRSKRGFPTKAAAEKHVREQITAQDQGTYVAPRADLTVATLYREWLEDIRPNKRNDGVKASTWSTYRMEVEARIIPALGHVKIQKLTAGHVRKLYDELEEKGGHAGKGLSVKSLANLHGVIVAGLKWAKSRDLIARVPEIKAPRPSTGQRGASWSAEQVRAFLDYLTEVNDPQVAAWTLLALTGMRRGEVAGLTWEDVDLEKGTLRVGWTLGSVDSKATWKQEAKTKAGQRIIALDRTSVALLREHAARQMDQMMAAGTGWVQEARDDHGTVRPGSLVFTHADGRMIHPERWTQWFDQRIKAANARPGSLQLTRIRLHDLRHTYATLALQRGGYDALLTVSRRLGHKSVQITLDLYSHVLPELDAEVAQGVADYILGT